MEKHSSLKIPPPTQRSLSFFHSLFPLSLSVIHSFIHSFSFSLRLSHLPAYTVHSLFLRIFRTSQPSTQSALFGLTYCLPTYLQYRGVYSYFPGLFTSATSLFYWPNIKTRRRCMEKVSIFLKVLFFKYLFCEGKNHACKMLFNFKLFVRFEVSGTDFSFSVLKRIEYGALHESINSELYL